VTSRLRSGGTPFFNIGAEGPNRRRRGGGLTRCPDRRFRLARVRARAAILGERVFAGARWRERRPMGAQFRLLGLDLTNAAFLTAKKSKKFDKISLFLKTNALS
jgi:hypothetical protein